MQRSLRPMVLAALVVAGGCNTTTQIPQSRQLDSLASHSDDEPLVYLGASANYTVRIYDQTGHFDGFIGGLDGEEALIVAPGGDLYVGGRGDLIYAFHPGKRKPYRRLINPNKVTQFLALDRSGNLYVADSSGSIEIFEPGKKRASATLAAFQYCNGCFAGLALDSAGNVYADNQSGVLEEIASGSKTPVTLRTFAQVPSQFGFDATQNLVTNTQVPHNVFHYSSDFSVYAPPYTGSPIATYTSKIGFYNFAFNADYASMWVTASENPPVAVELSYPGFERLKTITWRKGYYSFFEGIAVYPPPAL